MFSCGTVPAHGGGWIVGNECLTRQLAALTANLEAMTVLKDEWAEKYCELQEWQREAMDVINWMCVTLPEFHKLEKVQSLVGYIEKENKWTPEPAK